ncbi:MAG: hypothetical protein IKQ55_01315 [Kiritimatiellae bacterium]|nr:hypothetical protein [Kiritimatiellia bacterium]
MKRVAKWVWRVVLAYGVVLAGMRVLFAWPHARSAGDWVQYLAAMTEDSTLYAEGYDEKAFRSLRPGMSAGEVEDVLGEPLWRREGGEGREVWAYSSTRGAGCVTCPDGFFWKRWVVFGSDGKVLETESAYWDN